MNRIYKVVWSKAKNCYTVVSEIAKRHGKGNRARTCAAAFLAAFALTGVMGMSEAQAAVINANTVTIDDSGNVAGANSIQTNALNAKYNLSVGTANPNGSMPFFVNSNGAFYAANGKLVVDKDGKVTATEGEIGNVVLKNGVFTGHSKLIDGELLVGDASGSYSQITPNSAKLGQVTIDEKGNIAGANSIQTNALNAKYNLSVGTANPNGSMPFFVNSNGAFYAANGKLVVDKDGKVTATEGEIGNVVLKNGVFTGNSALRDGELLVGDASGNYSQITPKSAKLGKVTIDDSGNVAGANSIQTNALNAKYNLSVGTANPNGSMPFFVNSNGAFYAANGKLVVDKDGKVTATEGEIGNVVLKNGVFTGNSALRDGELLVGDASGNYSQITTKGAKLGKVIVAEDGKITGVAAGALTADSTDAVNGSQLKQTNDNVASNTAAIGKLDNRVTDLDNRVTNNTNAIAQNKDAIDKLDNRVTNNTNAIAQNKDAIDKLDNRVTSVANLAKQHTTVEAGNNITVTESTNTDGGKKYTVGMAKDITVDSVKVGDDIYVSDAGLNANGKTITNVKDGKIEKDSKDAVNGGQLYATNQLVKENASNISLLGNSINKLDNRVDKVGAGAAALAALHPLGFDPEDKWDFAAGYGNYSGASAVALGAYYRPNEDTMFSVGGSFGNGENMVNAGVSLKLGQSNHAPTSKEAAMEKKISALSQEVEELKAAIADLRAAQTKAKDATEKDAQKK